MRPVILSAILGVGMGGAPLMAAGLTLVQDGAPKTAVWFYEAAVVAGKPVLPSDREAAEDLATYIKQMSGAQLELKTVEKDGKPGEATPAVLVGKLARETGMDAPPKTLSGDGYRLQLKGNHLLLAGENEASTFFATAHLLENFGCRWFIDNDIGTVVPTLKTLEVGEMNDAQQPSFISRSIWGPNWGKNASWLRHNRQGGMVLNSGHNWPRWFCTTDPKDRAEYLSNVLARVEGKGAMSTSISPPDGTRYCPCDRCKALDDPAYLEPSSGAAVMSDRYEEFYKFIGNEVKKVNPDAILCHYGYADYTLPPRKAKDVPDNLCAFLAPIRFCRVHSMSNPLCEARQRCRRMVQDWAKVESKIGWREYNYNLAEMTVPFSKMSIWKEDIPWLKAQGCIALNIECLYQPHIYGPHTYLVARLAWDANGDVAAIMDDFYTTFCGPAAPFVKAYWERIDKAYRETPVHAGSFAGVHAFWTPELIKACQADLDAAAKAAAGDELIGKRVAMFQMGLDNAKFYAAWREAVNRCDFEASQVVYDKWMAHMDDIFTAKIHPVGEYKRGLAPRFLGKGQESGYARVTGGRKRVMPLPDEWEFRYDADGMGESNGWHKAALGGADWKKVKTYSATLNEQQIPEQLTWMWYRTTIKTPKTLPEGPLALWLMEPDGNQLKVWLNGEPVMETADIKSRQPYDLDLTGKLKPDTEYVVSIRLWHKRISELMLGGLLRPVMIYSGAIPPPPPPPAPVAKPSRRPR